MSDSSRRERIRKTLETYAVDSLLQYRLLKWRRSVLGRVLPLVNRLRRKKIAHILPLGINCEVAFWLNDVFGFVESSLFAWVSSRHLDRMARVLSDPAAIMSGEMRFSDKSFMWECVKTGLFFHGRFAHLPDAPLPDQAAMDADLADLRGRVAHLKEKFLQYVRDDERTLFIHRISDYDVQTEGLDARLAAVEKALEGLGARKWQLLIVCRKADRHLVPPGPHRLIRTVWRFNPTSCLLDKKKGDSVVWHAIFSEFVPVKILQKRHAFKFETAH